jgi:hypothetical protein
MITRAIPLPYQDKQILDKNIVPDRGKFEFNVELQRLILDLRLRIFKL